MAAVSAWSKPGAWALDSEAAEREKGYDSPDSSAASAEFPSLAAASASAEFPSLAAASASKPARKKKPQPVSLAEFTTGHAVTHGAATKSSSFSSSKGLTPDELLVLPTGPRERSAEELERGGRGFGYSSSFGLGRGPARGASDEPRRSREPPSRDLGPSRADEIDDWGAAKKSAPLPMPERRERSSGFFGGPSRADDSDSWVLKKSMPPPPPSNERRMNAFDAPREGRRAYEMFDRGVDSETWGRKREETNGSSGGRPRLLLQARTLPQANGNGNINGEHKEEKQPMAKSNPFGEARPREEVLAEKGQDWKKINEKLESTKVREAPPERVAFGRKGFGMDSGLVEDWTERAWRKTNTVDAPSRVEKIEEVVPDN